MKRVSRKYIERAIHRVISKHIWLYKKLSIKNHLRTQKWKTTAGFIKVHLTENPNSKTYLFSLTLYS